MSLVSMTGFGRGEAPLGARRLVAEARAVNHRFLEVKLRLGRDDGELEVELGKVVRGRLTRGAVTLTVREEIDDADGGGVVDGLVDESRAAAWMGALTRLGKAIGAKEAPSLALVVAQPGVVRARASEAPPPLFADAARRATAAALDALVETRRREGEELGRELRGRIGTLARLRDDVAQLSAGEPDAHRERLAARVNALLERGARWIGPSGPIQRRADEGGREGPPLIDAARLAQEIALLAERLDVTEELVRLGAHLDEARRLLDASEPAGRRLDFLSQEIHREVNTIGSKAQSAEIAARVIDMKAELERFREQVQNVE